MVGDRCSKSIAELFDRHRALFLDKEGDDSIFPRSYKNKEEKNVIDTFQDFYAANFNYDMTRQWIVDEGPFRYDYRWLSSGRDDHDIKGFRG